MIHKTHGKDILFEYHIIDHYNDYNQWSLDDITKTDFLFLNFFLGFFNE